MIAVWVSCGAASAVALKKTVEMFGRNNVKALNNPIAQEHPDNKRFMNDVSEWTGVPVETVTHPDFPDGDCVEIWQRRKAMSFIHGAPCTDILKKQARQHWESTNSAWMHVLGFTADERKRHDRFTLTERENVLPVLIAAGVTKNDCYTIIRRAGISLPTPYLDGMPNANCMGCVKATSPTYWNLVRRKYPGAWLMRASQSRALGVRLVRYKGTRIFLDELPPDAIGRHLKSMPDCSSFCEE